MAGLSEENVGHAENGQGQERETRGEEEREGKEQGGKEDGRKGAGSAGGILSEEPGSGKKSAAEGDDPAGIGDAPGMDAFPQQEAAKNRGRPGEDRLTLEDDPIETDGERDEEGRQDPEDVSLKIGS